MSKKYKTIEFGIGKNIDVAIKELKSHKGLVCGSFNGHMLYSDVDDIDSAYKKITGKTKSEWEEAERQRQAEYEREKREHEEAIPRLTIEWVEKGKAILDEKYHDLWIEIVPIRLGDLYRGMELGACLEIVEKLNAGGSFDDAEKIFNSQGHSGMSGSLVLNMISCFCDRGKMFAGYVRY